MYDRLDRARIISTFGPPRVAAAIATCSCMRVTANFSRKTGATGKKKNIRVLCCREVRHRIRLRGQNVGNRVWRGEADPPDTGELRQVLHHDMQRAREHRMERQLHVAQIVPRAKQRVSIARATFVFLYICCD